MLGAVCACLANTAWAAKNGPRNLEPRFVVQSWNLNQGLPQSTVLSLCRTHDGFLWAGTMGGLAQFDGVKFRSYRTASGNRFPSDMVQFLAEDAEDTLWIGNRKGLVRLRHGAFETYRFDEGSARGFATDGLAAMQADRSGNVWIANRNGELLVLRRGHPERVSTSIEVTLLAADADGGTVITAHSSFVLRRAVMGPG